MIHLGLIGFPLQHSFSKSYIEACLAAMHVSGTYDNYELHDLNALLPLVRHVPLDGLNVTIPYKRAVLPYLDAIDETAAEAGAVNTICIDRKGHTVRLIGYNTDVIGFRITLLPLLLAHHRKALVFGTGGAAAAVCYVLRDLGIDCTVVSRRRRAGTLMTYKDLTKAVLHAHTLLVNCTPLGMWPQIDTYLPIDYEALTSEHLVYDLVYNPEETSFMRLSRQHGATACNGLAMLHAQADAALRIWLHNQ